MGSKTSAVEILFRNVQRFGVLGGSINLQYFDAAAVLLR